jgi:hypothetical protein
VSWLEPAQRANCLLSTLRSKKKFTANWGWTPAYLWCRRAVARFSLLQQLVLLLLVAAAASCLLASTESCCRWQSALYLVLLS